MAIAPAAMPGLSLGISPSSSASSATGLDMIGAHGAPTTGSVSMGGAGQNTWVTGLVRDFAMGIAVALAAKWAWGRLK
jgi:hypothetical protein